MRVFKKIMYIILALLPILPIVLFAFSTAGQSDEDYKVRSFGRLEFSITETEEPDGILYNVNISCERDSFLDYVVGASLGEQYIVSDRIGSGAVSYRNYFLSHTVSEFSNDGALPFSAQLVRFASELRMMGLCPNSYVCVAVVYFCYLFMIEMVMLIFDLITFVPRKCREILEV